MIEAAGQLHETLALVAPGTVLRDGLERILRGRTGAIIVLGFDQAVVPLAGSAELRPVDGVRVLAVGHVGEALGAALPRG